MGTSESVPEQEKNFINLLSKLNEQDFIDNKPIIEAAGKLKNLSFVSNKTLQNFFLKEPGNIFILVVRCIEILYSKERDTQTVCGALLILSRLLPIICVSYKDISEISWLLEGKEPLLEKLVVGVKATLFAPSITTLQSDVNIWTWENISKDMENARYDVISIFVFLVNYMYYFPDVPEAQETIHKYLQFDPMQSQNWLNSILNTFDYRNEKFVSLALQYLEWALIYDKSIQEAAIKVKIFEKLASVFHFPIYNVNSLIPSATDIQLYELDIAICLMIIYLQNPGFKTDYSVKELVESTLRFLQLANEKGIVAINHRISLVILSFITQSKENIDQLKAKFLSNLGTELRLHHDSYTTAILETVSSTITMPKAKDMREMALNIIYNVAPYFPATSMNAAQVLTNILIYFTQTEESEEGFKRILDIIKRYVTSSDEAEEKRKKITACCKDLLEKLSDDKKAQLNEAISTTEGVSDDQIEIGNCDVHIKILQKYLVTIYATRNKASLDMLRKNVQPHSG